MLVSAAVDAHQEWMAMKIIHEYWLGVIAAFVLVLLITRGL